MNAGRGSPRVNSNYQQPMVHPQFQNQMLQQTQVQPIQQHQAYTPSALNQQQMIHNQPQQQASHPGTMQNPALKPPSQMSFHPQQTYAPQGMHQGMQQMNQPNAPVEPQHQYYHHQQQQYSQPPGGLQNQPGASFNPYSKNPSISLARPPSTTIYQQGYK